MKLKSGYLFIAMGIVCLQPPAYSQTLMQVYQQAVNNDPTILEAKATNAAEHAAVGVSRASFLPTINATIKARGSQTKHNEPSKTTSSMKPSAGLTLTQTLFNMGDWQSYDKAKLSAQKADLTYLTAQQSLILRVAKAYFDALSNNDQLELKKAESETFERELQQTKHKFTVGLATVASVHEAQAAFDGSIADIIEANNNLMNSYENLRAITGMEYKELARLNLKIFEATLPEPATVTAWINLAETNSPSLLAEKLAKQIAFKTLSSTESGHYPKLSLNANLTNTFEHTTTTTIATNNTKLTNPSNLNGWVDLTLTIPITNGLHTYSDSEQKRFRYVAASQRLVSKHRVLTKDIRNDFNNIQALISTIKAEQQSVLSATTALSAIRAGYEVGTKTVIDLLNSTKRLYQKKSQLAKSRFDYINAHLKLKADAGTLDITDLQQIEKGLQQQL